MMEVQVEREFTEHALIPLLMLCSKLSITGVTVDGEKQVVSGTDDNNNVILYSDLDYSSFQHKLYINDVNKFLRRLKVVFSNQDNEIKTKMLIDEADNFVVEIRYTAGRFRTSMTCSDIPQTEVAAANENFGNFNTDIVIDKQAIKIISEGSKTITSVNGVEDKFSLVSTSGKVVLLIKDAVRDTIEIDLESTSSSTWGFAYDLKMLLNVLQLFKDGVIVKIDETTGLLRIKYTKYDFFFIPHL